MSNDPIDDFMDPRIRRLSIRPCRGHTDTMYPDKGGTYGPARRLCANCEAQLACLAYAIRHHEHDGMWGGHTPLERLRLTALLRLAIRPPAEKPSRRAADQVKRQSALPPA